MHIAAWRHPDAPRHASMSLKHYQHAAQTAERGLFDFIFFADNLHVRNNLAPANVFSRTGYAVQLEPITLLSAIAGVTSRIGLVSTVSTSYWEPYTVARLFASLDHISDGRAGWNVVTSATAGDARNFGRDEAHEHGARYARAREFVKVVTGLWDSWDDDAFIEDKQSGIAFDPDKVHILNHRGEHFNVRGPLNVARPVQGHPVIVQAGASEAGQNLAAETAEVVFTGNYSFEAAQAFYRSLKGKLPVFGRRAEDLVIMPGLIPVVGRTEDEAKARHELLQGLIDPVVSLAVLSRILGEVDLAKHPLDGPLPDLPESNASKSGFDRTVQLAKSQGLTIRQLCQSVVTMGGHRYVWGTAKQIADELEEWFHGEAADGFNIIPPWLPGGLDDFVDLVVPELQRRGLVPTAYAGSTLREHLGLARPANTLASNAALAV